MSIHEHSILIERPVSEVFAYMDDVSREREWQPHLVEAEQIPPGAPAVGTRKRYVSEFMGKRLVNTYVAKVYEPERRVVLETTPDSAVHARSEVRWERMGDATRVTMAMEGKPTGALRLVPRPLLDATFEKEVTSALRRLKERLESGR